MSQAGDWIPESAAFRLRRQYERFPYPPVPWLALPTKHTGKPLRLERGIALAGTSAAEDGNHRGKRILVAGCGTLEPLVVALQHPHAREVVGVDFSSPSCSRARLRTGFARLFRRMPPVRIVNADLLSWEGGRFDYIIASNVLHHVADPAALLARLADWLIPGGWMRIVTYPHGSRLWMRQTARYLRARGIDAKTPALIRTAVNAVRELPVDHPVRNCFESQPERATKAGLVDAFFNELENPLRPLEWAEAVSRASLTLMGEDQNPTSQSGFLSELVPATGALSRWERLQILDDLLELCANPVLWLRKDQDRKPVDPSGSNRPGKATATHRSGTGEWKTELRLQLDRAEALLRRVNTPLSEVIEALRREVGPRVGAPPDCKPLSGLSITEYDLNELCDS